MRPGRLEFAMALIFGAAVIAWCQLPQVWAEREQILERAPALYFTGAMPTYADDAASYWMWMRQAREGNFLFTDLYTTEPHPRNYVNVLFWGLGTVSRWTGVRVEHVYALSRPAFGALLLVLVWLLAVRLFDRPGERFAFVATAFLHGGWGPLTKWASHTFDLPHVSSPEWWLPEMSTPFSMMLFPHFLAGFAAQIAAVLLVLRAWQVKRGAASFAAAAAGGLVLGLLTFFHPYDVIPALAAIWGAVVLFWLRDRKFPLAEATGAFLATAVWVPSFLYNLWVFLRNPAMRAWDLQNVMITPDPIELTLSLGIGGALAVAALFLIPRLSRPQLLMAAWFLAHIVVIHLPVRFQRRMIGGIQFPIAALTVMALAYWVAPALSRAALRLRGRMGGSGGAMPGRGALGATLAALVLIAPLQLATPLAIHQFEWMKLRKTRYASWLRAEERAAILAIGKMAPAESTVLSSYEMGSFVPPYTGCRTLLGHYALTIDSKGKQDLLNRFFREGAADDAWRFELIREHRLRYLLYTSYERQLGDFAPESRAWLREVFRAPGRKGPDAIVYAIDVAP